MQRGCRREDPEAVPDAGRGVHPDRADRVPEAGPEQAAWSRSEQRPALPEPHLVLHLVLHPVLPEVVRPERPAV